MTITAAHFANATHHALEDAELWVHPEAREVENEHGVLFGQTRVTVRRGGIVTTGWMLTSDVRGSVSNGYLLGDIQEA